jgi:hypothetical protein
MEFLDGRSTRRVDRGGRLVGGDEIVHRGGRLSIAPLTRSVAASAMSPTPDVTVPATEAVRPLVAERATERSFACWRSSRLATMAPPTTMPEMNEIHFMIPPEFFLAEFVLAEFALAVAGD